MDIQRRRSKPRLAFSTGSVPVRADLRRAPRHRYESQYAPSYIRIVTCIYRRT